MKANFNPDSVQKTCAIIEKIAQSILVVTIISILVLPFILL